MTMSLSEEMPSKIKQPVLASCSGAILAKQPERDELAAQMSEFFARGGVINTESKPPYVPDNFKKQRDRAKTAARSQGSPPSMKGKTPRNISDRLNIYVTRSGRLQVIVKGKSRGNFGEDKEAVVARDRARAEEGMDKAEF